LSKGDRVRLRQIIRAVHMRHHPKELQTDAEADKIIDVLGPEVVANIFRNFGKKVLS